MEKDELNSLNVEFSEMELHQLEERLETTSLLGDGFVDLESIAAPCTIFGCPHLVQCGDLSC